MKTVIEMAREAGATEVDTVDPQCWIGSIAFESYELEAFAELVRADEREKYKWDIHSCGPTCKRYACVAMREAVEAEREACAKVCEKLQSPPDWNLVAVLWKECRSKLADAIRARGNT